MNDNTINADVTMGGAAGTLLAGRYRVVRQLGQGGMGSVWLAEDTKLDGFKVAVKMLPSILVNNKRAYNQLKAEALVSLKLTYPNIATVRAFEENGGNPFLVMDYIDGLTLDEYLAKKGALDEETTYALLEPVARALDYAHEKGVVHRDVKPGNVMITWDGDPFVLDFGIAREIQETMTRVTGKLSSGTLLYMSPEQLKGEAPKPAQDVYSFAAMAYECLKGEPPFSRGQVEWQIMNQEPEPLVGGALATSVMRGLAKDPAQRPGTCRGVLAASRPRARPSFGPSRSDPKAAKSVDETLFDKVALPLDLCTAVLNNKWMALVLIGLSSFVIFRNIDFGASEQPVATSGGNVVKPSEEDEKVDKGELDKTRIEAQVKVAACRRLDRGDGFGAKIEECENELVRAKAEYELKRWGAALRDYKEVLEQSSDLVALDAGRLRARAAAEKMEIQARAAKDAAAERYATVRFNAAKDLIVEAKKSFAEMLFAEAADKHELAARQFELAIGEAKAESVRQKNWRQKDKPFTIADSGLSLTMKWCPAGSFDMGSPENEEGRKECEKQHRVTLTKGFWLGETEVTQGQWKKLMNGETVVDLARKELMDDVPVNVDGIWQFVRDYSGVGNIEEPQDICGDLDDDVPVYHVNWNEAMTFCRKLTEMERVAGRVPDGYEYRLPTEAEWEYACRATTTTALLNGQPFHAVGIHNASALDDIAWYGGNSSVGFVGRGWDTEGWVEKQYSGGRAAPRKVKGKSPNKWGLFDMTGNVGEWCSDITSDYRNLETDPLGALKGTARSFRGGAWLSPAVYCRSASRCWIAANYRHHSLGLRVALAPQYADYPYEVQPLTGQDLKTAVEEARKHHDSLQDSRKRAEEQEKQKQECNAKPTVYLTASLNGESKNAEIVEGVDGKGYKTPILINITGPLGATHDFVVKYEAFGRTYRGRAQCISRKGRQTLDVPLRLVQVGEQEGRRAGASEYVGGGDDLNQLLMDLEGASSNGPKFCRHCGAKLAGYSNVGTTCPACKGNLLGE